MSLLPLADCWPRRFTPASLALQFCEDPTLAEQPLFAKACAGEAVAQLWQAPQGFVVPGSYRQFADLPAVSAHFAARGWPVWLRRSGGGLVPQGPGIINLSLAWPVQQPLGEAAEPIYHSLCAVLQRTLARFGVASHPRAVSGSFCDGRYNLACGEGEAARKIVGTAQYWRPLTASGGHVVLAHAVILIDVDLSAAHQAANAFEAQLGSERVYRADKTVTLAQLLPGERHLLPRFSEALARELDAAR
ncbi:lipoate--protein ligase family protein [Klebsiella quasipneumoniae subsp. similipneumoniae]|uniref:lipoyl protein ligase domain-containing protein n=1 Tax=Klebsiella quasipneumoniae TaxID=1463165 RepID=UPI002380A7D1|nr:lipoate--protein ligase family protein [Klebsiella quasipneumoniae]MDE4779142.1 lipoate--protein ligase family protein [Klebsiella quasipneumoniae subsp. similipneumoniae]